MLHTLVGIGHMIVCTFEGTMSIDFGRLCKYLRIDQEIETIMAGAIVLDDLQ